MRTWKTVVMAAAAAGCSGTAPAGTAAPAPVPADPAVEAAAVSSTALRKPVEIVFDWRISERETRFTGKGVARIAGNRARVDLFGPRGETYLSAVLLDRELRLPAGLEFVPLPPPDLFWSVLGVFRPPAGVELVASRADGGSRRLEYRSAGDRWQYRLDDGRLTEAEWTGAKEGRRTVQIVGYHARGVPEKATYRDWPAFVELDLTLQEVREVDGFPDDTWTIARD